MMKINLIDLILIVLGVYTIYLMLKSKGNYYRFGIVISALVILKGIDNIIWKLFDMKEKIINNYMAISLGTPNDKLFLYYYVHVNIIYIIAGLMWIYIIKKFIEIVKYKWKHLKK
ncbi:MAG: hypothetical protein ACLUUN_06880 [Muribaculaceae bacterium]